MTRGSFSAGNGQHPVQGRVCSKAVAHLTRLLSRLHCLGPCLRLSRLIAVSLA